MQNKRQEQLLAILSERRDWMTSRQLAGLLQVSDRTIRSDVEAINKHTDPPPIESNVRQGGGTACPGVRGRDKGGRHSPDSWRPLCIHDTKAAV